MKASLIRMSSSDQGTFGKLSLSADDGSFLGEWVTVELPWRDNAPQRSCVPVGDYMAKWLWSESHKQFLYHLQDVPNRSGVEIHAANFGGNTALGWHSDLLGCIALGKTVGPLQNPEGRMQQAVLASRIAMQEFTNATAGVDLQLTIQDEAKNG